MVRDKYAPGLLELDRMGHGFWTRVMELYNEEVAEGDMGAEGAEGDNRGVCDLGGFKRIMRVVA